MSALEDEMNSVLGIRGNTSSISAKNGLDVSASALIGNDGIDADSYIIVPDDNTRSTDVEGTGITDNYTKMFTHFSTSSMYATEPPAYESTATFFKVNNNYALTPQSRSVYQHQLSQQATS